MNSRDMYCNNLRFVFIDPKDFDEFGLIAQRVSDDYDEDTLFAACGVVPQSGEMTEEWCQKVLGCREDTNDIDSLLTGHLEIEMTLCTRGSPPNAGLAILSSKYKCLVINNFVNEMASIVGLASMCNGDIDDEIIINVKSSLSKVKKGT